MTSPATLIAVPQAWVPDYLHGSLRHWEPRQDIGCRCRSVHDNQVIHCVGRIQHFLDVAFGRAPHSRCGVRLLQERATALLEEGAPLCPVCVAITHPPAATVEVFNHRGDPDTSR